MLKERYAVNFCSCREDFESNKDHGRRQNQKTFGKFGHHDKFGAAGIKLRIFRDRIDKSNAVGVGFGTGVEDFRSTGVGFNVKKFERAIRGSYEANNRRNEDVQKTQRV